MYRVQKPEIWSLCALLLIWICVIISNSFQDARPDTDAAAGDKRPILILDAGHGGMDGGAISVTGVRECEINWQIAERVRDLAGLIGVEVVCTREHEEIEYPPELTSVAARKKWDTRRRVRLVNGLENGILISIHQNSYPTRGPRGVQVLYRGDETSSDMAKQLFAALSSAVDPLSSRLPVKAGKDIFLLSHSEKPAVLIECGFISNPTDAVLLESASHQKKLSLAIAAAYFNYTGDEMI